MTSLTFGEPAYDGICICPTCSKQGITRRDDKGKMIKYRRCAEHMGKCNQCWVQSATDEIYGRCEACRKGKTT